MAKKTLTIECTSAFVVGGDIVKPGTHLPGVPESEAKSLIRRGKAVLVETEDQEGPALSEMTVAELKDVAEALQIDGFESMKKADLIAAIEAAEAQ